MAFEAQLRSGDETFCVIEIIVMRKMAFFIGRLR